jgi:hypothetical protein
MEIVSGRMLLAILAVVVREVRGKIESDETNFGAAISGFETDDVLVLFGACTEFEVVVVEVGRADVIVLLLVAGKALRCARWRTDGAAAATLDDVAIALRKILAVEGENFILLVRCLEASCLDAEMEAAEVHIDVGGVAIVIVLVLDGNSSRIGCEADGGGVAGVVSFDLHGAEGRSDVDILLTAVLVLRDAATEQKQAGKRGNGESAKCAGHSSSNSICETRSRRGLRAR